MPKILEVKHLTKRFGELAAVDNLSFDVEEGEVFGIAGPNGSGKTTLFNLISGHYSGAGEIVFSGERIDRWRAHRVCQSGLARTFQIPAVFSSMSVYDNVRAGVTFGHRSPDKDRIIGEVLAVLGLEGKRNLLAGNLSLFDRKLTMLAAALATQPRLLMLDEPIAGLSPVEIAQSISLFRQINQDLRVTLIVIEHVMRVLVQVCDQLMILHDGQRISQGRPEEVARDKRVIEVYLGEEDA